MVLVDTKIANDSVEDIEAQLTAAVVARKAEADGKPADGGPASNGAPNADASNLPAKLRGKSPEEIAEMYANLESAYGRMANDLGTQRKLTDQLLALDEKRTSDLSQNTPPAPQVKVSGSELLENPMDALDKYFAAKMAELQTSHNSRIESIERSMNESSFYQKHGDVSALGQDPEFQEFCSGSPYRAKLAQQAANGDYAAADEVISEWKDLQSRLKPKNVAAQSQSVNSDALEAARKASLESSSSKGASSDKYYSRSALIRLKLEKPHLYEDPAFQDEIIRAYRDGRVK